MYLYSCASVSFSCTCVEISGSVTPQDVCMTDNVGIGWSDRGVGLYGYYTEKQYAEALLTNRCKLCSNGISRCNTYIYIYSHSIIRSTTHTLIIHILCCVSNLWTLWLCGRYSALRKESVDLLYRDSSCVSTKLKASFARVVTARTLI